MLRFHLDQSYFCYIWLDTFIITIFMVHVVMTSLLVEEPLQVHSEILIYRWVQLWFRFKFTNARFPPSTGKWMKSKLLVCIPVVVGCLMWDLGLFFWPSVTSHLFLFLSHLFFVFYIFSIFLIALWCAFAQLIVLNKVVQVCH